MLVDDANLDRDLPWHDLPDVDLSAACVLSPRVRSAKVNSPGRAYAVVEMSGPRSIDEPIQYWTPQGHNAWVGDVAVCEFGGRFHVFYLHDRRNHGSMEGKGGHYFAHVSSPDLLHWTEHRAAVPIVHSPETLGTGTPFVYDGNLCLAFGFHTMRFMPADKTTEPLQRRYYEEHGREGVFDISKTPGSPAGGSFAVSRDGGETFARSGILPLLKSQMDTLNVHLTFQFTAGSSGRTSSWPRRCALRRSSFARRMRCACERRARQAYASSRRGGRRLRRICSWSRSPG